MAATGHGVTAETGPTASNAFEVLGHETRLAIIEELAKHRRTQWQPAGLGFAELRKAVGVEDAGKFNYHLGKLTDHFVFKRGDEYVLQNAGLELAGAIRAGTYTEHADTRRSEIDRTCPTCDAPLEAIYEHGYFRVECPDHGHVLANTVPPGAAAGRSMAELLAVADRDARHTAESARGGVCPHCWGRMDVTIPADLPPPFETGEDDDGDRSDTGSEQVLARFACDRCGMTVLFPVATFVVDHPAVVSLYHDHGVDLRERGYLELDFIGSSGTVVSEEPTRVAVDIELAEDALRLTLDGSLTVVDVEKSAA